MLYHLPALVALVFALPDVHLRDCGTGSTCLPICMAFDRIKRLRSHNGMQTTNDRFHHLALKAGWITSLVSATIWNVEDSAK
jgi:hypothetical protein